MEATSYILLLQTSLQLAVYYDMPRNHNFESAWCSLTKILEIHNNSQI